MTTIPHILSWPDAAPRILAHIAPLQQHHTVIVIGITGPVGAGKTTLSRRLTDCIISTDNYLPDYEIVPYADRDRPEHSDLPRLAADLAAIRRGQATRIPVWSFHTHKREGEQDIHPAPVIVCEGIHALHSTHSAQLHVKVYIDAPQQVRWRRWEMLERTGQRGWGVEVAREYFNNVAEPTFCAHAANYRNAADFVVINDGAL